MLTIREYRGRPGQDDITVSWILTMQVGKDIKAFDGEFTFSQSKYITSATRWSDDELKAALAKLLGESITATTDVTG